MIAHSTALLADAGHNLSDVLGLLLAWGAAWLTTRRPSARYTFGFGSTSILASLANAALLLFACGAIVTEAIGRLMNPAPVAGLTVFVVATVGMLVNGFSAWLFMRGQKEDLNIRGAFLHMAGDAADLRRRRGERPRHSRHELDVARSVDEPLRRGGDRVRHLGSAARLGASRAGCGAARRRPARASANIWPRSRASTDVHDLHVWALSTTGNALSAHLVMPEGHPGDAAVDAIVLTLREELRDAARHAASRSRYDASLLLARCTRTRIDAGLTQCTVRRRGSGVH